MESQQEIFSAADVILIIIKNEGEMKDDIEYPEIFSNAYDLLQRYDIIKNDSGRFVNSQNYDKAYENGVKAFIENVRQKKKAIRRRKNQQRNVGLAVLSSAAIAVAAYIYKKDKH